MSSALPILQSQSIRTQLLALNDSIRAAQNEAEREKVISDHISSVEDNPLFQVNPDFPGGSEWFNVAEPLGYDKQLRGKIVVLDFFTYCCINCVHVLPTLARIEASHPDTGGVAVIGVHSAKFQNEKLSESVRNAVGRNAITHPVVNDAGVELWERLGVQCWPTMVVLGPRRGSLLHYVVGEAYLEELVHFVDGAVRYYNKELSLDPIGITQLMPPAGCLRYPGKVCLDQNGTVLHIADTGNSRVVAVDRGTGAICHVYGTGSAGRADGRSSEAQFNAPQGIAQFHSALYVADTENHLIRKIDISSGTVSTIAGTGRQGNDLEGGKQGCAQEMSSPWDIVMGTAPGVDHPTLLYVAMAGTHQLWVHFLEDSAWLKGSRHVAGTSLRFCGSGEEANRNNSYPAKAAFAQPSGLSAASDGVLYVADSESSTIRAVSLANGSVKDMVGGAIDPLNLFAFGDVDGKGRECRLQHPLGVAWCENRKNIYIADSYNHKIKTLDPATKVCSTLAGTGHPGLRDGPFEVAQFSEPGGLCVDAGGNFLFVADTNNHAIRVLDLTLRTVSQLIVTTPLGPVGGVTRRKLGQRAQHHTSSPVPVPKHGSVAILVKFQLPQSCHITEDVPSTWQLVLEGNPSVSCIPGQPSQGSILENAAGASVTITTNFTAEQESHVMIEACVYFCEDSGMCRMHEVELTIPLVVLEEAPPTAVVQYQL